MRGGRSSLGPLAVPTFGSVISAAGNAPPPGQRDQPPRFPDFSEFLRLRLLHRSARAKTGRGFRSRNPQLAEPPCGPVELPVRCGRFLSIQTDKVFPSHPWALHPPPCGFAQYPIDLFHLLFMRRPRALSRRSARQAHFARNNARLLDGTWIRPVVARLPRCS
jgi:hypothetical protein